MIGRLAVRRPWVFEEARGGIGSGEQGMESLLSTPRSPLPFLEETGLRFLELLSRYQPAEFHVSRARRFFHYFCDNLRWGNYVKNLLNRETDLLGIERAWRNYFLAHKGDEIEQEISP